MFPSFTTFKSENLFHIQSFMIHMIKLLMALCSSEQFDKWLYIYLYNNINV